MALNPSGAISLAGPTAGQSIAVELGVSATATISLNDTNVRTLAGVASGVIVIPTDFWGKSSSTTVSLFAFGTTATPTVASNARNLVLNTGVIGSDTPGAGTARASLAGSPYGGDKGIYAYGSNPTPTVRYNMQNLVSNTGVVASDTTGIGIVRASLAAATYGGDKGIFGYGQTNPTPRIRTNNLVSNTGVIGSDNTGVGQPRGSVAAAGYGGDKAIFGYGFVPGPSPSFQVGMTNLVSNTGVVAADTPVVGSRRSTPGAAGYGGDKAFFGMGTQAGTPPTTTPSNVINLVSNTGVVATDTPTAASVRGSASCVSYSDKAMFAFGPGGVTNLVSNTGVVASDTPGVGSAKINYSSGIMFSSAL